MKINLEILEASYVYDAKEIEELNTKALVPKMMTRRRLTRNAKIAVYLAHNVSFKQGKIIYGSSFGELPATANILNSIANKEPISPTHFQNSVYNTAVSYLSILNDNQEEIVTLSSGDKTSQKVLQVGAIKALNEETLLLMAIETLNIENIEEVNHCGSFLEAGVALKVRLTKEEPTLNVKNTTPINHIPNALQEMFLVAQSFKKGQKNIIEVAL